MPSREERPNGLQRHLVVRQRLQRTRKRRRIGKDDEVIGRVLVRDGMHKKGREWLDNKNRARLNRKSTT